MATQTQPSLFVGQSRSTIPASPFHCSFSILFSVVDRIFSFVCLAISPSRTNWPSTFPYSIFSNFYNVPSDHLCFVFQNGHHKWSHDCFGVYEDGCDVEGDGGDIPLSLCTTSIQCMDYTKNNHDDLVILLQFTSK